MIRDGTCWRDGIEWNGIGCGNQVMRIPINTSDEDIIIIN